MEKLSNYLKKQATSGLTGLIALRHFSEESLKVAEKIQKYCTVKLGWRYIEDRVSIEGKTHKLWIDQLFEAKEKPDKDEVKNLEWKIKEQLGVGASIVVDRYISVSIHIKFPEHIDQD